MIRGSIVHSAMYSKSVALQTRYVPRHAIILLQQQYIGTNYFATHAYMIGSAISILRVRLCSRK